MGSLYDIDDLVIWENEIYVVKSIHYVDYYVYGLVPQDKLGQIIQIMVKESLLKIYTNKMLT